MQGAILMTKDFESMKEWSADHALKVHFKGL